MADQTKELLIRIKGDGSGLVGEVLKGKDALKGFGDEVDRQNNYLKKLTGYVNEARLAVVAYATGQVLNFHALLEQQDAVGKLSQVYGIAIEQLSSYSYMAKLAKISDEELALGLRTLIKNMDEAVAKRGDGGRILQALGLTANGKGLGDMLGEIADKFQSFKDGPEKAALAIQLFGRSGERLIPFLNQGSAGIAALKDEAERLGITFGGETARRAQEVNDNLTRLNATFTAGKMAILHDYLPAVNDLIEQLQKGKEITGGFASAILTFGTMNPFRTPSESIAVYRKEIEQIKADSVRYGKYAPSAIASDIASLEQRLEFAKFLQQQEALKFSGPQYLDARDLQARAEGPKPAAPRVIDQTAEKQLLTQLRDEYSQLTAHVSTYDSVRRKMADGTAEYEPKFRAEIELWAKKIDALRRAKIESANVLQLMQEQEQLDAAESAREDAAIASRVQLYNERKQAEISAIADPVVRARKAYEEESRLKYEQLVKDKGNVDEFKAWQLAREKELNEQIKPEYQKNLDAWSDTNRLMRENWEREMLTMQQAGEDFFVQFVTTGKASVADLAHTIEVEIARSLFRSLAGRAAGSSASSVLSVFGLGGTSEASAAPSGGGAIIPILTEGSAGLSGQRSPAVLQYGSGDSRSIAPSVSAPLQLTVHAPGATPGMEAKIRDTVLDAMPEALYQHRRAIAGIVENQRRESGRRRI